MARLVLITFILFSITAIYSEANTVDRDNRVQSGSLPDNGPGANTR